MPSAAERTRTLVQSTCSAVLLVPGLESARPEQLSPEARSVGRDGDVFLAFPAASPVVRTATHAQDDDLPAVLEITDVAPVSVPNRIRGRAWLSGWITCVPGVAEPGHMMLRLELGEASVDDLWGAERVEPGAFAEADPDPLVEYEADLLQHLHSGHGDQVRSLWRLLGERREAAGPDDRAVPLALDRFGLRVRFTHGRGEGSLADRSFDARFEFPEPVRNVVGLRRAMHRLFDAAEE
ncbi:DUF2470 domain-containing protein [Streptomyces sp. AV19]|uniref:DUF2470 domain-containing protein n=1 Tax=Streptomyces sp. AV19 TaxID=2793068 RepID=UPI0018FED713|nr:DUF2470 domain-containing protein [Streptomyces sp. AV19]MBH1936847.1 DUF2470 domain-containing protein [Streptomyces sp. AV19]MDG4532888.1 DUF2470 domain-containing protein [Streptomyces sp. AV19]